MADVRRPAYVVLSLDGPGGPASTVVPVAAYHAPSRPAQAEFGAFMAGLSRELYVTNDVGGDGQPERDRLLHTERVVFGGDFNYSVKKEDWPGSYVFFVDRFKRGQTGGAQTVAAPPWDAAAPARRTTVQLLTGMRHDEPIDSDDLDDYLRHEIDLVFTRGPGVTARRVNVPGLLLDDAAGVYRRVLRAFYTHLTGVVAGLAGPHERQTATGPQEYRWVQDARKKWSQQWKPMITGSGGATFESWNTFMTQLRNGRLADARRTAEFYNIFVSDHLPLVARITW